jgi:hypothetical protein
MSTAKRYMLCAAIFFCTTAGALAHTGRSDTAQTRLPSTVYGTFNHCSPSNRIDLSRLQAGEISILIQDRGFRTSNGSSAYAGECLRAS